MRSRLRQGYERGQGVFLACPGRARHSFSDGWARGPGAIKNTKRTGRKKSIDKKIGILRPHLLSCNTMRTKAHETDKNGEYPCD